MNRSPLLKYTLTSFELETTIVRSILVLYYPQSTNLFFCGSIVGISSIICTQAATEAPVPYFKKVVHQSDYILLVSSCTNLFA